MQKICIVCNKTVTIKHIAQKYHKACATEIRLEKERARRSKVELNKEQSI